MKNIEIGDFVSISDHSDAIFGEVILLGGNGMNILCRYPEGVTLNPWINPNSIKQHISKNEMKNHGKGKYFPPGNS